MFVAWSIPPFRGPILRTMVVTWSGRSFHAFLSGILKLEELVLPQKHPKKDQPSSSRLASRITACIRVSLYCWIVPVVLVPSFEGNTCVLARFRSHDAHTLRCGVLLSALKKDYSFERVQASAGLPGGWPSVSPIHMVFFFAFRSLFPHRIASLLTLPESPNKSPSLAATCMRKLFRMIIIMVRT